MNARAGVGIVIALVLAAAILTIWWLSESAGAVRNVGSAADSPAETIDRVVGARNGARRSERSTVTLQTIARTTALPIANAQVHMPSGWSASTGADGRARVPIPDGDGSVTISAPGHFPRQFEVTRLRTARTDVVTIELIAERELTVRVVGDDGRAVPDALVRVENTSFPHAWSLHGRTNAEGEFVHAICADTPFRVVAGTAPDRLGAFARRPASPSNVSLTLVLRSGSSWISGRLVDAARPGEAVEGTVEVIGLSLPISTDEEGRFRIDGVHDSARLRLRARADGCVPARADVLAGDVVVIPMERGVEIRGRVVGSRGEPIAGAAVRCTSRIARNATTELFQVRARSGPDGHFRLPGVARQQDATVQIEASGIGRAVERIAGADVSDPSHDLGELVVIGGRQIRVQVRIGDQPAPADVSVHLLQMSDDDAPLSIWASTSPSGVAQFADLPPSRFRVRASVAGERVERTVDLADPAVGDVELALPAIEELRVRVVDEHHRPVVGVRVQAWRAATRSTSVTTTDEHGLAVVHHTGDRPTRIRVDGNDIYGRPQLLEAQWIAVDSDTVEVVATRGARIRGVVVDENGAAVPGVQVRATRDARTIAEGWSDDTGAFQLVTLPFERVSIQATGLERSVTASGGTSTTDARWSGAATVDQRAQVAVRLVVSKALAGPLAARLRLVDAEGTAVSGVTLETVRGDGDVLSRSVTDRRGNVELVVPFAGVYQVRVSGLESATGISLELQPATSATWSLRADRAIVGTVRPAVSGISGRAVLLADSGVLSRGRVESSGTFVLISPRPVRGSTELELDVRFPGEPVIEIRRRVALPDDHRVDIRAR